MLKKVGTKLRRRAGRLYKEHVAIGRRKDLSPTFDHPSVDGAAAARFVRRVKRSDEKPDLWLAKQEKGIAPL